MTTITIDQDIKLKKTHFVTPLAKETTNSVKKNTSQFEKAMEDYKNGTHIYDQNDLKFLLKKKGIIVGNIIE